MGSRKIIFTRTRHVTTCCTNDFVYLAAAVLLILKFLQYVKVGRGSQIAYILYRDGFVEFAGK